MTDENWVTTKQLMQMFNYASRDGVNSFAERKKVSKKKIKGISYFNLDEFEQAKKEEDRKNSYRRITSDTEADSKGLIVKWLNTEPLSIGELSRRLDRSKETIVRLLDEIHTAGIDVTYDDASKQAAISKKAHKFKEPLLLEPLYKHKIKVGCISDTHLGSYYQQLTLLRTAYKIFDQEKIDFITHSGDLCEGYNMHSDQDFECHKHGFDDIRDYAVDNYPESKRGIRTYCVAGGSLILTENGHKPIEEIVKGDKVLGDDGYFHFVTDIMKRNGITKTVDVKGNLPLRITSEHPILSKKEKEVPCRLHNTGKRKFCRPSCFGNEGKLVVPLCEKYKRSLNFSPNYIEVSKLKSGDLVACSFPKEELLTTIDLSTFPFQQIKIDATSVSVLRKNTDTIRKTYNRFIPVDEDLAYFFGLYAAEGSFNGIDLNFTFSTKEVDLQQFVGKMFDKLGIQYRINNDGKSAVNVSCSSELHVSMFASLFGKGAGHKKVPSFFFKGEKKIVAAFLRGYIRGDGSRNVLKGGRCFTAATVSAVLAQDVALLGKKIGIITSICKCRQSSQLSINYDFIYQISFTGENLALISEASGKLEKLKRLGDHNKSHWFGSFLMRPIRDISDGLEETVYNLEVEGVNSYVVEGLVVHNCIGGSHDMSYKKQAGANIVRAICEKRPDLIYRGEESASFSILGKEWFNVNLLHPAGGGSYARSYKLQKQTEALVSAAFGQIRSYLLEPDSIEKENLRVPTVLLVGHYHSAAYLPQYLGVDSFLLPCFEMQTPYLKRKSLFPQIGFLILTIEFDEKKNVTRVVPDFRFLDAYAKEKDY